MTEAQTTPKAAEAAAAQPTEAAPRAAAEVEERPDEKAEEKAGVKDGVKAEEKDGVKDEEKAGEKAGEKPALDVPNLPDRGHLLVANTVALDPTSQATLAKQGLEYRAVDHNGPEWSATVHAVSRGFLDERPSDAAIEGWRAAMPDRRSIGIYDPAGARPEQPIATVASWVTDVTVDTGRVLPTWAISAVTVSATHRRRGLARAMLEGELRAAHAAGLPLAGLTVSESTIYGRYGFGPATIREEWTIQNRRAGWLGLTPVADGRGRLDHVEREEAMADIARLYVLTSPARPGDVAGWPSAWVAAAGLIPGNEDKKVRAVRYTDAAGEVQGLVTYEVKANEDDYTSSTLRLRRMLTRTPDAHAALWLYVLTHDLIGTVKTYSMAGDDPLPWCVANPRAIQRRLEDDHWLRILDVPAALSARRYPVAGAAVLDVTDPLGLCGGRFRFVVDDDGEARVERVGESAAEAAGDLPVVHLGVAELASVYLGTVRWSVLAGAGRVIGDAATLAWLDVAFVAERVPSLSIGY